MRSPCWVEIRTEEGSPIFQGILPATSLNPIIRELHRIKEECRTRGQKRLSEIKAEQTEHSRMQEL